MTEQDRAPFLLAGRVVCVLAGGGMFVLALYWQLIGHPFFLFQAVIGLGIVAASLSSRPTRVLAIIPVGAPAGLWCLMGNGPVEAMGYAFLGTVVGAALVYQGCKDLKARPTLRGVVR